LFDACAKLLAGALLALSEAAIKLVESAGKIQTRMFHRPRTCDGPRRRQSKGRTRVFAADSPGFSGKPRVARDTKGKAVHAQTGKLCRPAWHCGMRENP
jgi:hypothetical protein